VSTASPPRAAPRSDQRSVGPVLGWWAALLLLALALWWVLSDPRPAGLSSEAWPYAVAPPLVAVAGLTAIRRGLLRDRRWPVLLALGFAGSVAWTSSLAATNGALRATPVSPTTTPPLPRFLLERSTEWGVAPLWQTAVLCLTGALAVPLAAVAVRSLCGERAARELLPVLALAPFAVLGGTAQVAAWVLGAAALAAAALSSEPGRRGPRRLRVAILSGLLLGTASLFGFAAVLLGAGVVCVFFVRRRPLLNVAAAAGFLVPILAAASAGYDWTADLAAALADSGSTGYAERLAAAVVALLLLGGPALVASARSMRNTPGWPFLVAGSVGVLGAVVAGLLADRTSPAAWLPVLPWLLVGAVARARPGGPSRPAGLALLGIGAASAYAVALLAPLT